MRIKPLGFLIFLLWAGIWQVSADEPEAPSVDLKSMSSVGIVGQYSGISLYPTAGRASLDPTGGSLFVETQDGFELIGTTSDNGTIKALCTLSRDDGSYDMFVGGDFSYIESTSGGGGSVRTNNIVRYDPSQRAFFPLEGGLDAPVLSLYCDNDYDSVYVGGTFSAPAGGTVNVSEFGGHVALWQGKSKEWSPLPFKGFNGPVETIVYDKKNATFYFGGQFDATGNGEFGNPSGSQPLNMENADITAGLSSLRKGFSDPRVVTCSVEPDGPNNTWLLSDSMPGYWRVEFPVTVSPASIGIKNTAYEGRGTKTFRLISTPDNTVYNLSYADPDTGEMQYCTDPCPLAHDAQEFQEFTVMGPIQTQGLQIDIIDFYGEGGGLHGVQFYQSDIVVRAAGDYGFPSCADAPFRPEVSVEGNWESRLLSGVWENVLMTTVPANNLKSSDVSVTLKPFVPATGFYEVTLFTPSCLPVGCSQTTSVEVTLTVAPGQSVVKIVSQRITQAQRTQLYSGTVLATSNSFAPTVKITVAEGAPVPTSGNVVIYVGYVEFVHKNGGVPLSGLFQYWPQRNAREVEAWGGLADILPPKSTVRFIEILDDSSLVVGGKFANTTYANIVHYKSGHFVSLAEGGLNGELNSIYRVGDTLIVGGKFTKTSKGTSKDLNNIARYSISKQEWSSADSGVNGAVDTVSLFTSNDTKRVRVFGQFTALAGSGNISHGYSVWDEQTASWSSSGLAIGQVNSVIPSALSNDSNVYIAGKLAAFQETQAFGASILSDTGEITALPIYPKLVNGSEPGISIYSGAYWEENNDGEANSIVIGGEFVLGDVRNIAMVKDGALTALDGTLNGRVHVIHIRENLLFIGGEFVATQENIVSRNFAIYDLRSKKYQYTPQLAAQKGDSLVHVNTIMSRSVSNEVIVGGRFSLNDGSCAVICAWNVKESKWAVVPSDTTLSGEAFAIDFIQPKQNIMLVAGNLTVDKNSVYLASYDFDDKKLQPKMSGSEQLPGPAHTVVNSGSSKKIFITGTKSDNNGTYLSFWDGTEFQNLGEGILLAGSKISQLNILQATEHEGNDFLDSNNVLSLAGALQIKDIGNVSVALYDGNKFYSYIISSQAGGQPGNVLGMFFGKYPSVSSHKALSVPVVIIISCLISGALVGLVVLVGMIIGFFRRRSKTNPGEKQQTVATDVSNQDAYTATLLVESGKKYASGTSGKFGEMLVDDDQQAQDTSASQKDVKAEAATADQRRTQPVGDGERDSGNSANSDLVLARKVAGDLNAGDPVFPVESGPPQGTADSGVAAGLVGGSTVVGVSGGYASGVAPVGSGGGAFQEILEEAQIYYAQFPFEAKNDDELGLQPGDKVYVVNTSDPVWWMGLTDDGTGRLVQGVFPRTYVTSQRPNLQDR